MSLSSPDPLALAGLSSPGSAGVQTAQIPAYIRKDGARAVSAYAQGLAFEQVLVGQLTKELAATVSDTATLDGSSAGDGSGGLFGSGSSEGSQYGGLVQQALTQSIMAGGGTGIATEVARALDPAIGGSQA